MPIGKHSLQLSPDIPAAKKRAEPFEGKLVNNPILQNASGRSISRDDMTMNPRLEWAGDLLIGELPALIAVIDEIAMPRHPPELEGPNAHHQHRGLSISE